MQPYTNLPFIREKISQVPYAIMYNLSNDLIRLPNGVIKAITVDEEGRLWFTCDKPAYKSESFPPSFPVSLQFYKKGESVQLKIDGPARILKGSENDNQVMVQMYMKTVLYADKPISQKKQITEWPTRMYQWMSRYTQFQHPVRNFFHGFMAR